jgi:hypothetical protein
MRRALLRNSGRLVLTLANLGTIGGMVNADWNASHIFNERWPSHARFHGVVGLGTPTALALFAIWHLWNSPRERRLGRGVAAAVPIAYWGAFFPALLVRGHWSRRSATSRGSHRGHPREPLLGYVYDRVGFRRLAARPPRASLTTFIWAAHARRVPLPQLGRPVAGASSTSALVVQAARLVRNECVGRRALTCDGRLPRPPVLRVAHSRLESHSRASKCSTSNGVSRAISSLWLWSVRRGTRTQSSRRRDLRRHHGRRSS